MFLSTGGSSIPPGTAPKARSYACDETSKSRLRSHYMVELYSDAPRAVQVAVLALVAYAALVVLLRVSGKRTLTDLNAFDFVVTVALGSILATTILSPSVALVDGLTALAVLIICQGVVALLASRFDAVRRAVKSEPALVVHEGRLLHKAMRDARLSEAAVLAAVRSAGRADLTDVHAIVLETNGALSVVPDAPTADGRAMEAARNPGV